MNPRYLDNKMYATVDRAVDEATTATPAKGIFGLNFSFSFIQTPLSRFIFMKNPNISPTANLVAQNAPPLRSISIPK